MNTTVNMKENRKSRKKIIALLIMVSLVLSSGTFAYWASNVEGTSAEATGTLAVGSGDTVETVFDLTNELNSGGLLVPGGQAINSGKDAVEAIDLSFDVQWLEDEATTQMLGVDSVGQIVVEDEVVITLDGKVLDKNEYSNIYDLVNVIYNSDNASELTLDAAAQTFAFQITLDEPANQEEYNFIANAQISVTFGYSISTDDIVSTDVQ
jgi:hypothetical protein